MMMWFRYGNELNSFGGLFLLIFIIVAIIIGIFIYLIVKLVQSSGNSTQSVNNNSLNILSERLAKGEITPEEYTNLKNILENKK
ncbi:MAG: SHOCT domain-containing protein [Firmicutes bacterium]|nr:SHOCT domain-containing protein [Bacillota bacterium]